MITTGIISEEVNVSKLDNLELRVMITACQDISRDEDTHPETKRYLLSRVRSCRRELIKRKLMGV